MGTTRRDIEARLRYTVDQTAANSAVEANENIAGSYRSIEEVTAEANAAAAQAIARANAATEKQTEDLDAVQKELAKIERSKALKELALNLALAGKNADDVEQALKDVGASSSEVRRVTSDFERFGQTIADVQVEFEKLQREAQKPIPPPKIKSASELANERFDDVSRNVGLAGDVQSNLGAISGLAGAAGAGGAATSIAVAGEFAVLAEELPRLKTALQGMPQVIGAAATALGIGGAGLVGGIAALAAVALLAQRNMQRAEEAAKLAFEAQQQYNELLRMSTDDLAAQAQELATSATDARQRLSDAESALQLAIDAYNEDRGTNFDVNSLTGNDFESRANRTVIATDTLGNQNARILAQAIAEYQLAAEDAVAVTQEEINVKGALNDETRLATELAQQQAEAMRVAAEARQAEIDATAELERQTRQFIESAESSEAIEDRIQSLEIERATIEETLQQENLSQEARERYKEQLQEIDTQLEVLNEQGQKRIKLLDAEAEAIRRSEEKQRALEEAEKQAEREQQERTRELEQRTREIGRQREQLARDVERSQTKIADIEASIVKERESSARKIENIERQLALKLQDAARQREQAIVDAQRKANQERENAAIQATQNLAEVERERAKELERIRRDFNFQEQSAVAERDAVALFNARQTAEQERSEAEANAEERRRQIDIELQNQNRLVAQRLQEQTLIANQRYQEQILQARQAAELQIQQERERLQVVIAERQRAIQEELALLQTLNVQGTTLFRQFVQNNIALLNQQLQAQNQAQNQFSRTVGRQLGNLVDDLVGSLFR